MQDKPKSDAHSRAEDEIEHLLAHCTTKAVQYVRDTIEEAVATAPLCADEHLAGTLRARKIETRLARDLATIHDGVLDRWDRQSTHLLAHYFRSGCPVGSSIAGQRQARPRWSVVALILLFGVSIVSSYSWADQRSANSQHQQEIAALNGRWDKLFVAVELMDKMQKLLGDDRLRNREQHVEELRDRIRATRLLAMRLAKGEWAAGR